MSKFYNRVSKGYICPSAGIHLLYICKILTLRHKNAVYLYSSKVLKHLLKIRQIIGILLSLFVIGNFRGTRSSIEMLMGCMVRESLGTPVL